MATLDTILKTIDNLETKDMSNPQSQLYALSERIWDLYRLFKGDREDDDIMQRIKQIELQMQDIMTSQQRQENLMNLIIQLLSKDAKTNRKS